ncbi:MAG: hypothetical protein V1793_13895 [Pseudomonadota bacterium]
MLINIGIHRALSSLRSSGPEVFGDRVARRLFSSRIPFYSKRNDEIRQLIRAFGDGACRAKEAGFDAVQIHGAHAYLFSQFLSSFTNRRTDKWGGSLENRSRFLRETCREIRSRVSDDYPIMIKLGVEDGFEGGLTFEEGATVAEHCVEWGIDALEVSQGLRGHCYTQTEFGNG